VISARRGDGLYARESITWRVARENALLLGGGRALLMQLAHPLVARAVAEHSDFDHEPMRRLERTLALTLAMVFGSRDEALAATRQINHVHAGVKGDGYTAMDPELLLWVHATLVDSAIVTYRLFVGPLADTDCDAYYRESWRTGRLLGIPQSLFPPDWPAFIAYLAEMIDGSLRVGDVARGLSTTVLHPRLGVPPVMLEPLAIVTAGLLPESLREDYALAWGRRQRAAFAVATRTLPGLIRLLPDRIRLVPYAREA
jgi:uncharacterized protein (DUF2236 family)